MEYSTVHLLTGDNDRWDCIIKRKISFAYFCAANQANLILYLFLFTTFGLVELFSETRRRYIQIEDTFFPSVGHDSFLLPSRSLCCPF